MAGVGPGRRRLPQRTFARRIYSHTCRVSHPSRIIQEPLPSYFSNRSICPQHLADSIHDYGSHSKNLTYSEDARLPTSIAARTVLVILGVRTQPKPIPISVWRHYRGRAIDAFEQECPSRSATGRSSQYPRSRGATETSLRRKRVSTQGQQRAHPHMPRRVSPGHPLS
jgi:hypothetical protein